MSFSPLLLLRCDVSAHHGTGHLMRGQALAEAWRRRGGRAEFVTTTDLSPYRAWLHEAACHRLSRSAGSLEEAAETRALAGQHGAAWVAADGYAFNAAWQEAFGGGAGRLLLLDDYGHGSPYSADLVLNQNPDADPALYRERAAKTQLLLGSRFAVLREQFTPWRGWRRQTPARARRLLISFGGTDPSGLTLRAVAALRGGEVEAEIVIGAGNARAGEIEQLCAGTSLRARRNVTDMPQLMAGCDFSLGAAGSTTLECAFLQLPQILFTVAENQLRLAGGLVAHGAAELLGWHTDVGEQAIAQSVRALAEEAPRRAAMSAAAATLVDGWGAERVVTHLRARDLILRPAGPADERQTWEWANDPVTRASFFQTAPIPWEEHRRWFQDRLEDPQARLWMAEDARGAALGLVRFAWAHGEADASVVVAPTSRGHGHGAAMVLRGSHELLRTAEIGTIHARIRPENHASRAAFLRAGYRRLDPLEINGALADHFALRAVDLPDHERL